jgi:ketosteroid isomerase-like protein
MAAFAAHRDTDVLMQADRDFAKATAEKGVDGWMSFMAPGAVLLGAEPVVGPEKIKAAMIKELAPGSHLTWEPIKAEFIGDGNIGYTIGRFESRSTDKDGKPKVQKGTYMTTWQKQKDGSWKVIGDIGSADAPH